MKVDLHIHSQASDGILTAAEIFAQACLQGISLLAVTDHDATSGAEEAMSLALEGDPSVVPGVELSTCYKGEEVHILGYYPRGGIAHPHLQTVLESSRRSRTLMTAWMVERLSACGFPLQWAEVFGMATGDVVCRTHIYYAMEKHWRDAGEVDWRNVGSALSVGGIAWLPFEACALSDAVELIRDTGGIPVLAHPGLISTPTVAEEIMKCYNTGVEVYYGYWHNNEALTDYYAALAGGRHCLMTGGSDYHASFSRYGIGEVPVPLEISEILYLALS
jgi:predicted metal-dependent phosphoesterase TrpH